MSVNDDARAEKIIFVSHCILNQNAKARGIARYPAAITPVVQLLLENDVGIYQMPCPEMAYCGAMRWGQVKSQYDSPMFRRHCRGLAATAIDQAEEYRRSGYQVLGFIMVDGSPSCGLNKTVEPIEEGEIWGGRPGRVPPRHVTPGRGVYCEALVEDARRRDMADTPFVAVPEVEEAGPLGDALAQIKGLLR